MQSFPPNVCVKGPDTLSVEMLPMTYLLPTMPYLLKAPPPLISV